MSLRVGLVLVGAAIAGALAGAIWAQSRPAQTHATARAAFTEWVEPGAVDAERDRVLKDVEETLRSVAVTDLAVDELEFVTPAGRNFIDVDVIAGTPDAAVDAAGELARQLVASEVAAERALVGDELDRTTAKRDEIVDEIEEIERTMEENLAAEAAAKQALQSAAADETATLVIEERRAGEEYWRQSRLRNALLDEQNRFEQQIIRLEFELEEPATFAVVTDAHVTAERASTPIALGAVGGALALFAFVVLGGIALGLDRLAERR